MGSADAQSTPDPPESAPNGSPDGSPLGRQVRDAADLVALGVAAVTGLQADAAGVLEAGAATSAREIVHGADAVQTTAQGLARQASTKALRAMEVVAEALSVHEARATMTPERASLVLTKAREASDELSLAVEASGALTLATAAAGLAKEAADCASAFELRMVATAVAARKLAPAVVDLSGAAGPGDTATEHSD